MDALENQVSKKKFDGVCDRKCDFSRAVRLFTTTPLSVSYAPLEENLERT
jgi:hypothetical protein